ncbi:MAG: hypothetical protein HYZ57_19230 [Acidobacteria bacterium]|nr:hypothetical protein [Acidobacteriota bacterium]MBI3281963.1 hypothetical protein [Acidobacteriota bacterium]
MAIPNAKKYRITSPDGSDSTTLVAVLPKGADVDAYLREAAARFDWKGFKEGKTTQFRIRVGQQKQRKAK